MLRRWYAKTKVQPPFEQYIAEWVVVWEDQSDSDGFYVFGYNELILGSETFEMYCLDKEDLERELHLKWGLKYDDLILADRPDFPGKS